MEQNERDRDELQTGDYQTEEAVGGGRADDRSAVSEPYTARAGATASRKVRDDETGLSEEAPQGDLHDASDRGEAGRSLAEDRGGREEADLREYIPNGDEPWGNGGAESDRSDEVGADDERDQSIGGGRSSEQSDLRISEGKEGKVLSGDDMIAILRHGDYLTKSKTEIVSFLMSEDDDAKKTAFIHSCYPKMTIDTASEALAVSLSERAAVDMEFMSELTGKSEEELFADLHGVIFLNPKESVLTRQPKYLTADEYLSGNVREKLADASKAKEAFGEQYAENIAALEAVQPQDLTAAEIGVKLGSTWVPDEVVQEFVFQLLDTPKWAQWNIGVKYIPTTAQWIVTNKSYDRGNVKASTVYGTGRINAYSIIEETLNLKDVRIFDYVEDENGNKKPVLNKKETTIAQGKQEQIKRAFEEWIWKDATRREKLCALYNERFNSVRPREYDGSHIKYYGMNPEIHLRDHQTNAVARILYGGNSLLAHVVGAGKTYTMVAAAQESKRLGLCAKSMFVVPNHLVEQWASEYLQLYPSANILVTTKKDFETKNRKKFCARIATGDYDAIIIGHSQFEKIPMSLERQKYFFVCDAGAPLPPFALYEIV